MVTPAKTDGVEAVGLEVSCVTFTTAAASEVEQGLLGWLSFVLSGGLRIDGVALRLTLDRRMTLSFPSRTDRHGRRHPIVAPVSDAAREAIEKQVLAALNPREDVQP